MVLKNRFILRRLLFLLLFIGVFSCEDDIIEVTLYDKGTAEATASATSIESGESITFSANTTKEYTLEWTFPGGTPATSTDATVEVTFNNTSFTEVFQSEVVLVVKFIDNTTARRTFDIQVAPIDALPDPIPFGGSAVAIPGTIEAENYDEGGQGVAYNDAEEENKAETANGRTYREDDGVDVEVNADGTLINIGYTNADEWVNYTVDVADSGTYDFIFSVASGSSGGGKSIKLQRVAPLSGDITELGETGDFPNTGGWSAYTNLTISGVNLAAGINTLRVYFTGGSTNLDKITVTGGEAPLGPLNIAFVTDDPTSDAGYIALLEGSGHTVEAEQGKYNNLDAAGAATLNGFDLVIISRSTNSGNFDASIANVWAQVTKPVLNMSSYVARSTRLQFFNSSNQDESGGTSIIAQDPSHPIFTGLSLGSDNSLTVTASNLHVIVSSDPGNGTLLGMTGDGSNATIAEWDANTAAYDGATVFPSKRMFLAGTGGGFTYNDAGSQLFLNCVEYIVTGTVYAEPAPDPLNIAFVTDDPTGDAGYIALLEGSGHTVEAEQGKYNNLDAAGAATLNGFDLVIISRNTNSGNFDASIANVWAQVTKPVLNMSSYVARSTRLQFFNSPNQDESGGTSIIAQDPSHPIFTGLSLGSDNSLTVTASNLHVIVSSDPGNGTLLGLTGDGSNVTIAEWDANTAAYDGATVFPSKRMFLAGTGGGFTYNDAGSQLFLNCVHYIVK
ncbi:carbohydrate-binding protein [Aestuariivivens sediminis]|uniref:carbohydrate-binding protein n=1 Tax=Aestuariivivens sediminis TaxID=2913557 RepID=UPI001F583D03|nr:carbohydrate-binding protein [Aestuariivivens sediminis]